MRAPLLQLFWLEVAIHRPWHRWVTLFVNKQNRVKTFVLNYACRIMNGFWSFRIDLNSCSDEAWGTCTRDWSLVFRGLFPVSSHEFSDPDADRQVSSCQPDLICDALNIYLSKCLLLCVTKAEHREGIHVVNSLFPILPAKKANMLWPKRWRLVFAFSRITLETFKPILAATFSGFGLQTFKQSRL